MLASLCIKLERVLVVILLLQADKLLHQAGSDFLSTRLAIDVVHLVRVGVEIIKFPLINVVVEVNELVTIRTAYTIMTLYGMFGRIFIIVVVDALAPVFGVFALQQWQERHALNVGWHGGHPPVAGMWVHSQCSAPSR